MSGTAFDEKEVLRLLAEGSEFAFIRVFNQYRGQVYRVALRYLKEKALADEIVQEVFMEVWQKRDTLTKAVSFKSYLFGMARNFIYDSYRSQTSSRLTTIEFERVATYDTSLEDRVDEKDYDRLLNDAVELLPEQQKIIFRLAREENLSHKEIAVQTNLSVLAVKSHMKRALKFLREKLAPHLGVLVVMLFS